MPRLYREAPVNAIWEGSGNVMCLDVLRALKRTEEADLFTALAKDVVASPAGAVKTNFDAANESAARATVGRLAILAAAAALKASAPAAVTEAFIRTRLVDRHGALYGTATIDPGAAELLLQRALPEG
jgi:putative acyl-CoA dehydrogenase